MAGSRHIQDRIEHAYIWLWRNGLVPPATRFPNPIGRGRDLARFYADWRTYQSLPGAEPLHIANSYPRLGERTTSTQVESHYFYQAIWAGRLIASQRPRQHVDIGSDHRMISLLTWITKVVFVDIRPLDVPVQGLAPVDGSILALPFADQSLASVSCLHVAEHVGLGRYGDPLNPSGTRDAARELSRVLAPQGNLYFSLPVGRSRVEFNAHRVHTPAQVRDLFPELELVQFAVEDDRGRFVEDADTRAFEQASYACGMFWFRKKARSV